MADEKPEESKTHRFDSIEELMEHVEKEAQKRASEILDKYGQLGKTEAYDRVILKLLEDGKQPLSVEIFNSFSL